MACMAQGAYLLELDRQENRRDERDCIAPTWWLPFHYKRDRTLTTTDNEGDGCVVGAILEWDPHAAWKANWILHKPSGAPKAILVLRGTLLKWATALGDVKDDFWLVAWENQLKGSKKFKVAFDALKSIAVRYGSNNVCIAGHSLGGGIALLIAEELAAKEGMHVEAHLFNPPSISLPKCLKNLSEMVIESLKKFRAIFSFGSTSSTIVQQPPAADDSDVDKCVLHFYINTNDYVCRNLAGGSGGSHSNSLVRRVFVSSDQSQGFLEAHMLKQWWVHVSKLQTFSDYGNGVTSPERATQTGRGH